MSEEIRQARLAAEAAWAAVREAALRSALAETGEEYRSAEAAYRRLLDAASDADVRLYDLSNPR